MSGELLNRKVEYWEHQLLDLGRRNRMIHYRQTKRSTLTLTEPSFEEMYERLAVREEALTFQRPVDRETDVRVFSVLSLLEHLSAPLPVTIGDIKTESSILERQKTLRNLRARARLALEETGANVLYLSFGFIEWRDGKGGSAQCIRSPLILVPASLSLSSLRAPYTLSKYEDEIVVNPTLQYYLKTEYGVELPAFDPDRDAPAEYLKRLEPIADRHGWRILREVSLGLLSFQKMTMYNDLVRNEGAIRSHRVIRAMAGETGAMAQSIRAADHDAVHPRDSFQVLSADSSQQDALLCARQGFSFVMQGPPGTGKSQTITNIIAQALSEGKKVLFVSEKMAALQVVYRRLQEAQLAEFCLPLHSHKANKKEILSRLGANLELEQEQVTEGKLLKLDELSALRGELQQYAEELHAVRPGLSMSCYEVIGRLAELKEVPDITFVMEPPLRMTQARLQECIRKVREYGLAVERLGGQMQDHPWQGLDLHMAGRAYCETMRGELIALRAALEHMKTAAGGIAEWPALLSELKFGQIPAMDEALRLIEELDGIPESWFERETQSALIAEAHEAKAQYARLNSLKKEISDLFNAGIFDENGRAWKRGLMDRANAAAKLPLIRNRQEMYFAEHARSLLQRFQRIETGLVRAKAAFASAAALLGTNMRPCPAELKRLEQMHALLRKNRNLDAAWFGADLAACRAMAGEAKDRAARIARIRGTIAAEWQDGVFALDYAPLLLRAETEYAGALRLLRPQYHADKKQLQALYRTKRPLPDAAALRLLRSLQEYHAQQTELAQIRSEIERQLPGCAADDWEGVITAIDAVLELREIGLCAPAGEMAGISATLEQLIDAASAAFAQVRAALEAGEIELNIDDPEFDADAAAAAAREYLRCLGALVDHVQKIMPYLHDEGASIRSICRAIECIDPYRALWASLEEQAGRRSGLFDAYFAGSRTDWDGILTILHSARDAARLEVCKTLLPIASAGAERKAALRSAAAGLKRAYSSAKTHLQWLDEQFGDGRFSPETPLNALYGRADESLGALPMLENWMEYREARADLCENGLESFVERVEEMGLKTDLERVFCKGFYSAWIGALCDRSAPIRRFRRNLQDERIKRFASLDDEQCSIAQRRIRERLTTALPAQENPGELAGEMAILKKELGKKRNIMPLRKLFAKIPNLLMKLKPCLMMSPLSVAYFLEADAYRFDLVIFDEASQIFPEDAVGAIFRGAQVIIAGDSKQLPPTSFFAASAIGEEERDQEEMDEVVSDSVLEETAAVLPNRTLRWHYRSKDESLIAFANREMYGNGLITFPGCGAGKEDMGVEYVYVEDGRYEGGGKNWNLREAHRCVKLIEEHIRRHPKRSLGVIAFSEKQQTAIENALMDFRERHPEQEWFFDEAKDEPFFVKNLENVQGDERDSILFSICYAKDKNGKMHLRFGPLGQEGGERRLNVAITRAKTNIKLVGSILPADIDLKRTNAQGVRMLRSYIEFARRGASALERPQENTSGERMDGFRAEIASFLRRSGYPVRTGLGSSENKIDIAVMDPDAEGQILAGVECDGQAYIRARTVRDRDHLKTSILEQMGWKMYRVWSAAWVRDPDGEGAALLKFLASVRSQNNAGPIDE